MSSREQTRWVTFDCFGTLVDWQTGFASMIAPLAGDRTSDVVRAYKPAPWHFRAFQRLTRVNRCEWVHVACSWYHDIAPAKSLGINSVWLDRERTGEDATIASARVFSAADVVSAVEAIVEGCYA